MKHILDRKNNRKLRDIACQACWTSLSKCTALASNASSSSSSSVHKKALFSLNNKWINCIEFVPIPMYYYRWINHFIYLIFLLPNSSSSSSSSSTNQKSNQKSKSNCMILYVRYCRIDDAHMIEPFNIILITLNNRSIKCKIKTVLKFTNQKRLVICSSKHKSSLQK